MFVLTDGSVSNTEACIQEVKRNVESARYTIEPVYLSAYTFLTTSFCSRFVTSENMHSPLTDVSHLVLVLECPHIW